MAIPFLTAEWRHILMINYEVEPRILRSRLPSGVDLDTFEGKTFVTLVGFLFDKTRVFGLPIPFHRNFEEVNLRFYVRRRLIDGSWRRGVVFVKEIVPRYAIAAAARLFYGEPYVAHPMGHEFEWGNDTPLPSAVSYSWKRSGAWESIMASGIGAEAPLQEGSLEMFIAEHYFGYGTCRGRTTEYQVDHAPWCVRTVASTEAELDSATVYGIEFAGFLSGSPASAFVASGSPVSVYPMGRL